MNTFETTSRPALCAQAGRFTAARSGCERGELGAQRGDFGFELGHARDELRVVRRSWCGGISCESCAAVSSAVAIATNPAALRTIAPSANRAGSARARVARRCGPPGAVREAREHGLDARRIRAVRHARCACAQLAWSLRAAQQQLADDRGFLRRELEAAELGVAEDLLILRHAAAKPGFLHHEMPARRDPSTTNFTVGSSSCIKGSRLLF